MIGIPSDLVHPDARLRGPDNFGRFCLPRVEIVKDEWQPFAPFVARKHFIPLHVDMIPSSSWGASLSNLLTPDCWKQIRRVAFRRARYVCEICGQINGPVECHELWAFDDQRTVDGWNTQRLQSLLCLCHDCHEMFHPGLANINGRGQEVAERMMTINAWTDEEHGIAVNHMNRKFEQRSRKAWMLDLSILPGDTILAIKPGWRAGPTAEVLENRERNSRTKIAGVRFRLDL